MEVINVRKLQRNMKEITERVQNGESFAVYKNSTFVFQINPPILIVSEKNKKNEKRETLHDVFKSAQFSANVTDASQRVDEFVYKI